MEPIEQIPPHSIEAEQSLIGSMLIADKARQAELLRKFKSLAFFRDDHAIIWQTSHEMSAKGVPIDAITLRENLIKKNKLEEIGGSGYIGELLNVMPSAANADHYADIVKQHAARRHLMKLGYNLTTQPQTPDSDPIAIARTAQGKLEAFIRRAAATADRSGTTLEVIGELEAEADGRRKNESWPWPQLSELSRGLLPGSVTMFVADPGAGKTFGMLQSSIQWFRSNIPFSIRALERNRKWHGRRLLSLLANDMRASDDKTVRAYPEKYVHAAGEWMATIDAIGECIHDNEESATDTLSRGTHINDLADWVKFRCDAGDRIISIDPISLASTSDKSWRDQEYFLESARRSVDPAGASLLLLSHPRAGLRDAPPTMDDVAGGRVFVRTSDCIIWLKKLEKPRLAVCLDSLDVQNETNREVDRVFRIMKARDGRGEGLQVAATWNRVQGGLLELGTIKTWLDGDSVRTNAAEEYL